MGGHLTPFERALVRELALTGLFSTQRIAQLVQCSKATVIRIVKDIRHSEHIRFPSRTQLILKMHREGALNSVISRRLGITPAAVTLALKRHGRVRNIRSWSTKSRQKEIGQWTTIH
jgi:DNA-binding NarL/FixJ family response regulator